MHSNTELAESEIDPALSSGLRHIAVELTWGCNLRCTHCYSESDVTKLGADRLAVHDYETVLRDAFTAGCRSVQFIGGEPTLSPHLLPLVRFSRHLGYARIEIYSNLATPLWRSHLHQMLEHDVHFATSIYSHDPAIHDRVTRRIGSHRTTTENVQRLVTAHGHVRVAVIVMPENSTGVEQTVKFIRDLGVEHVGTDRVRGVGRGSDLVPGSGFDELCGHCWMGNLTVSSSGDVFPCIMARSERLGSIFDISIEGLIAGERLYEFRCRSQRQYESRLQLLDPQTCAPYGPCHPIKGCPPNPCRPNDCAPFAGPCNPFPK